MYMFRHYLKSIFLFCLLVGFIICATYIAGTFHPNDYTVKKIEDDKIHVSTPDGEIVLEEAYEFLVS